MATLYAERVSQLKSQVTRIFGLDEETPQSLEQQRYLYWLDKLHDQNDFLFKKALWEVSFYLIRKTFSHNGTDVVNVNEECASVVRELTGFQMEVRNASIMKLQTFAEQYFKQYFGEENIAKIDFQEKISGLQLGQRAFVSFKNPPRMVIFYIKTHRGGMIDSTYLSSAINAKAHPKPIDPKELFVYKVFERIGIGPEVHFFFEDDQDFYIATKDSGFDDATQKQKEFLTYESLGKAPQFKERVDNLENICGEWNKKTQEEQTLEASVELEASFGIFEQNITKSLAMADILSRIFLLEDLAINPLNFGFVVDDNLTRFRVIDFQTSSEYRYDLPGIYEGFFLGYSRYCCYRLSNHMRYALYMRAKERRIQVAREIMRELTEPQRELVVGQKQHALLSDEVLDATMQDVMQCVAPLALADIVIKDLERYVQGVKSNLKRFKEDWRCCINKIKNIFIIYAIFNFT